ncbi:hypothetical protein NH44784_021461 [Achromobacter xylosoxidans NH44784-1996]|nr:hypothetical protein NH44784_021461 [Achromobacter xylosoxidans NH44784-1996]
MKGGSGTAWPARRNRRWHNRPVLDAIPVAYRNFMSRCSGLKLAFPEPNDIHPAAP